MMTFEHILHITFKIVFCNTNFLLISANLPGCQKVYTIRNAFQKTVAAFFVETAPMRINFGKKWATKANFSLAISR
jgi:hypothetical protein